MTSTSRVSMEAQLAPAPPVIRNAMLAARDVLRPGAASVVGRLFQIVAERNEHWTAPSRASFDAAATSESTLQTLLATLTAYAPQVALGPGREARREWYARRPRRGVGRRRGPAPIPQTAPAAWPVVWQGLYPGLRDAPIKESSIRRHIASVDRLAQVLPKTSAPAEPGFYTAWCLGDQLSDEGLSHGTIAGYLDGLSALAMHGGRSKVERAGLVQVRVWHQRASHLQEKSKVDRIRGFVEDGGYMRIAEAVRDLREVAASAPGWSAEAEQARQRAAVLGVVLNAPARTGDVAAWRIGQELVRHLSGDWELKWTQQKTGEAVDFEVLWPEISALLDEHILGDRPARLAPLRYNELLGCNWLTLTDVAPAPRWPSEQARRALGLPLHDLRTIVADHLRWHDPTKAPDTIQALLGHGTRKAGDAYRAGSEGEASARDWAAMRNAIATSGGAAML